MSTNTLSILLILVALCAASVGVAVGWWLGRGVRGESDEVLEAAVSSAVNAVLAERGATAAAVTADRDLTVRAAVDTAVKVAGARLDDRMQLGSKEIELRSQSFEERASGINAELVQLRTLVTDLQSERSRQHGEVVSKLEQATKVTSELSRTTSGLREALANSRARGQWGERMAADVLRAAGMVEGVNYRRQVAMAGGRVPDFTFLLPKGLEMNMDVKFPIDNYLRYLDAVSDGDRSSALSAFQRDVRSRVKEITTRDYIDPERTVDHVLLFIPNESVYSFIHENDAELLDRAMAEKVVMCSPTTLFAVLAVVRQAVDNFQLERTSGEILTCLTRFRKQWDKFSEQVDRVGKSLTASQRAFDDLDGTRRRQFERELDRIDALQSAVGLESDDGDRDADFPVRTLRAM
ncbi:MAG TPA: DNA recombination protein RmuC [Acidimicrobiales bacterium]|nr:DNA recombination protein RmuC [Acidimicrobiales bacterium]